MGRPVDYYFKTDQNVKRKEVGEGKGISLSFGFISRIFCSSKESQVIILLPVLRIQFHIRSVFNGFHIRNTGPDQAKKQ